MKFEIKNQKENKLLNRKELRIEMTAEKQTPSNEEVLAQVTAHTGAKKELVVIDSIKQAFGLTKSVAYVKVYDSEADLKAAEPSPKKKADAKPSNVPDSSGEICVQVDAPAEEKKEGED
ncbi:MAG: hypothetical protein ABIG20_04250 [archaeon]